MVSRLRVLSWGSIHGRVVEPNILRPLVRSDTKILTSFLDAGLVGSRCIDTNFERWLTSFSRSMKRPRTRHASRASISPSDAQPITTFTRSVSALPRTPPSTPPTLLSQSQAEDLKYQRLVRVRVGFIPPPHRLPTASMGQSNSPTLPSGIATSHPRLRLSIVAGAATPTNSTPSKHPPNNRSVGGLGARLPAPPLAQDHAAYLRKHPHLEGVAVASSTVASSSTNPLPAFANAQPVPGPSRRQFRRANVIDSPTSGTRLGVQDRPVMVSKLLEHRHVFTGAIQCRRCDRRIGAPDKQIWRPRTKCITHQSIIPMLHAFCSACDIAYCRGCHREIPCKQTCIGDSRCPIINPCCPSIPALAIFEFLGAFDSCYLADPDLPKPATYPNRILFLDRILAQGPSSPNAVDIRGVTHLEEGFRRTLENLHSWLWLLHFRNDGRPPELHPAIIHLFAASFFMEILKGFLERGNKWYWIVHHETYTAIFKFLRAVIECGFTTLITSPFPMIYESSGVHQHVWGTSEIVWETARHTGGVIEVEALAGSGMANRLRRKRDLLTERRSQTRSEEWAMGIDALVDGLNFLLDNVGVAEA